MAKKDRSLIDEDHTIPFDTILAKVRETDIKKNPRIALTIDCKLHTGRNAFKVATILFIRNEHTGEIHHHELKFRQFWHTKDRGWEYEPYREILFNNKKQDQIKAIVDFLTTYTDLSSEGEYFIIDSDDLKDGRMKAILAVTSESEKLEIISQMLSMATNQPETVQNIIQLANENPYQSQAFAAALNIGRFLRALDQLTNMIQVNALEKEFQNLLENNMWMLGSEYSQLIKERSFFTEEQLDFLLQRTVDNYVEIVEIKRPLNGTPLFAYDTSHKSYYPRSELSQVIGQTMKYLDTLETNQILLRDRYKVDAHKIRAKIIIGRDNGEEQLKALRDLNSHLYRIEIITFDQLRKIAERVIKVLEYTTEV